jgi:hypothetical protein
VKRCPQCAEEVQDEAVKCRHCGSLLISDRVRRLAPRYGVLTEEQRKVEWGRLSDQEKRELPLALETLPKADPVKGSLGTLIAIVGVLIFIVALFADANIIGLVLGIAIAAVGMAMKKKAAPGAVVPR